MNPTMLTREKETPSETPPAAGALVRQVPPAEEPAKSAAKKRQCDRSHRSKERYECATRALAEEGDNLEWE